MPQPPEVRRRRDGRYVVARASDLPDGARLIVEVAGRSVGIFNVSGTFYALLNRCPHMGAELCKGDVIGLVEADQPGDVRMDSDRPFVSCPWHAWEYDLKTGQSWIDPQRQRVRPYPVDVERGDAVTAGIAAGTVSEPDREPGVVDTVRHRIKGRLVAQVVPIEVQDDYVVLSLARVAGL
jgi:nitrite reductase/ring-hydroxylating ferredoxin subunit